ncbi:MAG: stage III sporulation protein AF [Clostridia bacterium]|nr:stage III sporulation protein AF [Clostridia bacterium]
MSSWILSIVGVSLLTILCNVIMPDDKLNKYVKTVCSLVVVSVMFSPILGIIQNLSFQLDDLEQVNNSVNLETYFVEQTVEDIERRLEEELDANAIVGCTVEIYYHVSNDKLILQKAVVNIQNVVLTSPLQVIKLKENIEKILFDLYSFEQGVAFVE